MARYAHICGWGLSVPERVMTNDDWAELVDTTDEWITTRTGIKRRRFAADDETTLDLAAAAAERALAGTAGPDLAGYEFREQAARCAGELGLTGATVALSL